MDSTAFYKMTYGLYIASSLLEGRPCACVINTGLQVTSSPARLSITLSKQNATCQAVLQSGVFALTALSSQTPLDVIRVFGFSSSRDKDKFAGFACEKDQNGVTYLIPYALARFQVRVEQSVDLGTHILFIGLVEDAQVLSQDSAMTYDYYHSVKRGGTPKNAPSYQAPAVKKEENKQMSRYVCQICGYVYDEAEEGVKWEDLPDDYVCPMCGVDKTQFEKE